jgi:hypothetical protein
MFRRRTPTAYRLPTFVTLHSSFTQMLSRFFRLFVISAAAISCSRGDSASAHTRDGDRPAGDGVAPRPSVIAPASQPYKIVSLPGGSTISGTVDVDGTIPPDTLITPGSDQNICGNSLTDKRVSHSGSRIGGAIVWLTDIRSGKAFPIERRFELTNDHCTLDPYVQVIPTNSTLNVSNDDRALHTNRFINVGTGAITTVAPFNDDGEVVPVDRFREPAEIEVVCQQHPWSHAWLAVLDHPYYATTAANGSFTIETVPPGKYHLRAWHPALGYADDSVTVVAGQPATVAFRIKSRAAAAPAAAPVTAPIEPAASSTVPDSNKPTASSTPAASSTTSGANPPPRR